MTTIAKTLSDAFHENWKIALVLDTEASYHEARCGAWQTCSLVTLSPR